MTTTVLCITIICTAVHAHRGYHVILLFVGSIYRHRNPHCLSTALVYHHRHQAPSSSRSSLSILIARDSPGLDSDQNFEENPSVALRRPREEQEGPKSSENRGGKNSKVGNFIGSRSDPIAGGAIVYRHRHPPGCIPVIVHIILITPSSSFISQCVACRTDVDLSWFNIYY